MNGYTLSGEGFALREFPSSPLLDEEVRIRVEHCCLEPSDLEHAGDFCPGGSFVGTVIDCGSAATAFQNARVLVPAVVACGECDTCRRGAATVCPTRSVLGRDRHGGCGDTVVCSGRWLTRSDELLPLEGPIAALTAGPGLRAYGLYCRAGVSAGDVVIILGHSATAEILAVLATSRGSKVARGDVDTSPDAIRAELSKQGAADRPQKLFVCDGKANLALAIAVAHPSSVITSAVATETLAASSALEKELSLLNQSYPHPDLLPETAALVVKGELDLGKVLAEGLLSETSPADAERAAQAGSCLVVAGL